MLKFIRNIFKPIELSKQIDYKVLSVHTCKQEIEAGQKDKYGFIYSKDGLRLLKGQSFIDKAKIKKTVLVICDNAFEYCFLENIEFPKNLKRIGSKAFYHARCKGNFVLPDSLEMIDSEAFSDFKDESCNSLVNFTPDGIKYYGNGLFINSNIKRPIALNNIHSVPKDTFKMGSFESVQIPDTVETIEDFAFYNSKISTPLQLPESIKVIGESAFEESYSIEELNVTRLKQIGKRCFSKNKRLATLCLYKDISLLGTEVFENCTRLMSVDLSKTIIQDIPQGCFDLCLSLESVKLSVCITTIGARAFKHTGLKKLDISSYSQLTTIKDEAFKESQITEIIVPECLQQIGKDAFKGCSKLSMFTSSNPITEYGERCFENCNSLERIIGEINISSIPSCIFANCKKLKEIHLGNNVIKIGTGSFQECSSLEILTLPESLKEIGRSAFCQCSNLKTSLPSRIETLESMAFGWDWKLKSLVLPSTVSNITGNPFCALNIQLANQSPQFVLIENVLFTKDMTRLIYFGMDCEEYKIPDRVRIIGSNAFSYNWTLKKVFLPESLKKIEECAFYDCSSLSYINLNDDIEIEEDAFVLCRGLEKYHIRTTPVPSIYDIEDAYYNSIIDYDF